MYHRNKVHTDEFWKYELAKHRRTVLDSKTNEDMWKKQLGKHANEDELLAAAAAEQAGQRSRSLEIVDRNKAVDDRWLDQIKRTTSSDPNQNSQVSTEMKLLALQSLQNSLQMMSMKLPTSPPSNNQQEIELEKSSASVKLDTDSKEGYLTLLAHLSAQRSKASEQEQSLHQASCSRAGQRSQSESSGMPPYLSEMKEECATKRTQMWLAQLGQYRSAAKTSFQDDMDRNHEELWEEQIAKVKQYPVKSPLEPIEIIIEDTKEEQQNDDIKAGLKAVLPPPEQEQEQAPPMNVISIKTSAIQRVENQPRTFSLSLEINNNNEEQQPRTRHIPVPLLPTSKPLMALVQNQLSASPPKRKLLLDIPDDVQEEQVIHEQEVVEQQQSKEEQDQGSVLKSLLMDRLPRKRPLSPPSKQSKSEPPSKRLSLASSNAGESDILRRRLLGIKAEAIEESLPSTLIKPKFQPPTATITSQQQLEQQQQSSPVDLSKAEPQPPQQQPMKNYTQTSVLKHLLYRYTSSGKSEDELMTTAATADN